MSGRRPRLVIKPNIRPGAAKTTLVSKSKPTQSSSTSETPVSTKIHQAPVDTSEKVDTTKEDENQEHSEAEIPSIPAGEISSNSESLRSKSTFAEPIDNDRLKDPDPEPEQQIIPVEPEVLSVDEPEREENNETPCSVKTLNNFKVPNSSAPQQHERDVQEISSLLSKNLDDSHATKKSEDVSEAEGKKADSPEDFNESEASVASSLELDSERQKDVEETTGKKPRRHRSKKPKLEALPSRDKSPDRQKMKMSDLLLWNPERNFLPSKPKKKRNVKDENRPSTPDESIPIDDKEDMTKETENAALPAPQVMIGPDGNVVLNTESLLISMPEKDSHSRSKIIVEEDDNDRYLNTNSYRKHCKKKLWSEEETDKFFIGLSMCGTDFSLLTKLLTNRSRRELKNKFRREEKYNRPRVDKSLSNMRQYDPSVFVVKLPPPSKPKVKKQASNVKKEKEVKEAQTSNKASNKDTNTPEVATKGTKVPTKKEKVPRKKKAKKRKRPESSEDEEDDWGPEYDEIDEEEEMAARLPAYKRRSQRTSAATTEQMREDDEEDEETNQSSPSNLANVLNPSSTGSMTVRAAAVTDPPAEPSTSAGRQSQAPKPSKGIQAIPGTTQVQIEVSGVETPVQGMLIPSHMVPSLAPQLGLGDGALGGRVQVLLVHEESTDGSLVHVYIIPEDRPTSTVSQGSNPATAVPITVSGSSTSQIVSNGNNLSRGDSHQPLTGFVPMQTQHPMQHQLVTNLPEHHPGVGGSTRPSSSQHSMALMAAQNRSSASSTFPSQVHSSFPPTSPAGIQSQPQLSSCTQTGSSSPFPPATGMKSPPPFPPVAGVRPSSPFPPATGVKSPAPFPPTTRAGSSSPFSPASVNPSSSVPRRQSPFPPLQSGRKGSPFPPTASPTLGYPVPVETTTFPMSPPPLQGHRVLSRMPRPQPKVHCSQSVPMQTMNPTYSLLNQTGSSANPPVQNLLAAVEATRENEDDSSLAAALSEAQGVLLVPENQAAEQGRDATAGEAQVQNVHSLDQ